MYYLQTCVWWACPFCKSIIHGNRRRKNCEDEQGLSSWSMTLVASITVSNTPVLRFSSGVRFLVRNIVEEKWKMLSSLTQYVDVVQFVTSGRLQRKTAEAPKGRILLTVSPIRKAVLVYDWMRCCGNLMMHLCEFKSEGVFSKEGHVPLGEAFVIWKALSNVIVRNRCPLVFSHDKSLIYHWSCFSTGRLTTQNIIFISSIFRDI